MKTNRIKVGLVFGGKSGEHEVSLISAWNIYHGLDVKKYDISLIGIDKNGNWHYGKNKKMWISPDSTNKVKLNTKMPLITVARKNKNVILMDLISGKALAKVDVFFPITHGTHGEDGCLQGFLETVGAPYVGPGVLGSAVGMDKDVMKRLLRDGGLKVSRFHVLRMGENYNKNLAKIITDLKFPIFVKPSCQGSSVGISKTENKKDLIAAIEYAFKYDSKVILEQTVVGREIECGVLGNSNPVASNPGEIQMQKGFYSYDAKYIDDNVAVPIVGVKLPISMIRKIQKQAVEVFKILECKGLGRVDFFLTSKNEIFVNEINTLPGFTSISMYPKMFEQSGMKYKDLLDKLIQLALEKK